MGSEPRESGTWTSVGLTLSYVEWGPPGAPLVVIHHGWLDHGRSWDAVATRLADAYRVVVLDARGHGDSEWIGPGGSYYFSDYVLDLHALLGQLSPDQPVALVGHSMGGSVVGYFAGAFPARVRSLVLVEGLGPPEEPPEQFAARLQAFVSSTVAQYPGRQREVMESVHAAAQRLMRADPRLSAELATRLATLGTRPVPGGVAWKADPLHRARSGAPFVLENAMALWRRITAPTLVVDGAVSLFRWPGLDARRAAIAGSAHLVIDDAGHNVHLHAPAALADAIRDHLSAA